MVFQAYRRAERRRSERHSLSGELAEACYHDDEDLLAEDADEDLLLEELAHARRAGEWESPHDACLAEFEFDPCNTDFDATPPMVPISVATSLIADADCLATLQPPALRRRALRPSTQPSPQAASCAIRPRPGLASGFAAFFALLAVLLGLASVWQGLPERHATSLTPVSNTAAALPSRNIEDIQLGDRVAGWNPLREEVDNSPEPEEATWRKIVLEMRSETGGTVELQFLRPLTWLADHAAQQGGIIAVDMPELGAVGTARVLSIEPCPPIRPGRGHVVTGRFSHRSSGDLLNLYLEGEPQPIGVTAGHRLWSVDRQAFVPVGELQSGEQLEADSSIIHVVGLEARAQDEPIYNIEVHGEHVYLVGTVGVLVHNQDCLYRGVPSGTDRYNDALNGIQRPRGTKLDYDTLVKHVNNEPVKSGVTSWTSDPEIAKTFAGANGKILKIKADAVQGKVVPRPDVPKHGHEKEVLLKGTVTGFKVLDPSDL